MVVLTADELKKYKKPCHSCAYWVLGKRYCKRGSDTWIKKFICNEYKIRGGY